MPSHETSGKDKPGIQTSEFWVVAGVVLVSGLVNGGELVGLGTVQDAHAWASKIGTALAAMWGVGQYVTARTGLKQGPPPDPEATRRAFATLEKSLDALRELSSRLPSEPPKKSAQ